MQRLTTLILFGGLCLSVSLPALSQEQPASIKPQEIAIDFVGSNIVIQGKALAIPCELDEVTRILGAGDRVTKLRNWITTWDEFGLIVYCKPETTKVIAVAVSLSKKEFKFSPKKTFAGTVTLDGAEVTASSNIAKINAAKKGVKLIVDIPGLPASIKYPNALITVGEARRDGKLVGGLDEIAISWREPKSKSEP